MSQTSETYVKQISDLAGAYKKSCGAAALYYWDSNHTSGLRIECITVMKEFLNNVKFGSGRLDEATLNPVSLFTTFSDPEGLLFYNQNSDFNFKADEKVNYKTYYNTETPKVIRTDFFLKDDSSTAFAKVHVLHVSRFTLYQTHFMFRFSLLLTAR